MLLPKLSTTGLYGYSAVFLIVSLVLIYALWKLRAEAPPVALLMNGLLITGALAIAAFLLAMAWIQT